LMKNNNNKRPSNFVSEKRIIYQKQLSSIHSYEEG
jgi:hypothetical protein